MLMGLGKLISMATQSLEVMMPSSAHMVADLWDLLTQLPTAPGLMVAEPQPSYLPLTCSPGTVFTEPTVPLPVTTGGHRDGLARSCLRGCMV